MAERIFVTGSAGFIGYHLSKKLLEAGNKVVGIDNLNDYYEVSLKKSRLAILDKFDDFTFYHKDISSQNDINEIADREILGENDVIVNLAAQASVFYSLINPDAYVQNNLMGFYNILEISRKRKVKHLLYASSSSVYGGNVSKPYSVHHNVDHPISLYAATKKSNELLAHVYSYSHDLPTTGIRFFSVYGPWGRPDMALFLFTRAILDEKPIKVYNKGDMYRDFTYIDDITEGVFRLIDHLPVPNEKWDGKSPDPATSWVPYRVYNIGNHESVKLLDFIHIIEDNLGKKAIIDFQPIRKGDVYATEADIDALRDEIGFEPYTPIQEGVKNFMDWFKWYYNK